MRTRDMTLGTRTVKGPRISGLVFLLMGGIMAFGACTEDLPPPMVPPPPPNAVPDSVQTVFDKNCLGGCHAGQGTPGGSLDLSNAIQSYSNLVDVPANSCGTLLLVKPFDSANSCNMIRMTDPARPMPPGGLIPAAETAIVGNWVDEGALPAFTP